MQDGGEPVDMRLNAIYLPAFDHAPRQSLASGGGESVAHPGCSRCQPSTRSRCWWAPAASTSSAASKLQKLLWRNGVACRGHVATWKADGEPISHCNRTERSR